MSYFLEHGLDVNEFNDQMYNSLKRVLLLGSLESLKICLKFDTNLMVQKYLGQTLLHFVATNRRHKGLLKFPS